MPNPLRAAMAGVALIFAGATLVDAKPAFTKVASFGHELTGVTVTTSGRIFLSFRRWTEDTEISMAELKEGKAVPYPDADWNAWRNAKRDEISAAEHFVCVQAVVADHAGNVWALDPAAPALSFRVPGGPKLVEIDTKTNSVSRVLHFGDEAAPQGSYLNDIRFSPDDKWAYMTDSGAIGALVVVRLADGKATRLLAGDAATQADKSVTVTYHGMPLRKPDGEGVAFTADGLALSVDGETLYWQAIKGKTLYSLPTAAMRKAFDDPQAAQNLSALVQTVGNNGPADGLLISRHDGKMYVTGPEDDSIRVRDLDHAGGTPTVLLQDKSLVWPDTFAEAPDGTILFSTSHIPDNAMFKPNATAALPTELWSFKPDGK